MEDEDNVGSVRICGAQYNADVELYTIGEGIECFETEEIEVRVQGTAYTADKLYVYAGGVYREFTGTLYTQGSVKTYYKRSNGAIRYEPTMVTTKLYRDGGTHTYPLFTKMSKNLYAGGTTVVYPAYKKYGGKVYDAGKTAVIEAAEIETRNVTVLTV